MQSVSERAAYPAHEAAQTRRRPCAIESIDQGSATWQEGRVTRHARASGAPRRCWSEARKLPRTWRPRCDPRCRMARVLDCQPDGARSGDAQARRSATLATRCGRLRRSWERQGTRRGQDRPEQKPGRRCSWQRVHLQAAAELAPATVLGPTVAGFDDDGDSGHPADGDAPAGDQHSPAAGSTRDPKAHPAARRKPTSQS